MKREIIIATSNVQRIFHSALRIPFFTHYSKRSTIDLFLLSEVGILSDSDITTLTQEACSQGLGSIFHASTQSAILWRLSSPFFAGGPRLINVLASKLSFPQRVIDATFDIYGNSYHFAAVYVPVNPMERKAFLNDLNDHLPSFTNDSRFIIGGDWNCVQDPLLDSSNPLGANLGGPEFQAAITNSNLLDTYRLQNPHKRIFTNRATHGSDRRLDMIFVSTYLEGLVHSTFHLQRFKQEHTHLPICLRLTIPEAIPVGPGYFRLADDVLDRPGVGAELGRTVTRLYRLAVRDGADAISAWRTVKTRLAYHIRELDKETASEGRTEQQRHHLLSQKARIPSYQIGSSSVKLRLRQVRDQDLIPSIRSSDNIVLTDQRDMLMECHSFFRNLYSEAEQPSDSAIRGLLATASARLSPVEAGEMDRTFDLEELNEALAKCNTGSCPGPDGLSFYFYRKLWDVVGPMLVDYMNALGQEEDQTVMHLAHVSLLHKKGDKDLLNNKRPISLLNTDERILDQALNLRLCFKLLKLTHPTQTGFVPTRWIGDNIATVQQVLDEEAGGLLAFLDFDKAYDRLSHKYIKAVLENAGLGPRFRRWTMRSVSNASARIVMNGWLSEAFPIQRGLRQGSPFSPSLFALCIEPLAALLRRRLHGIRTKNLLPFQNDIAPFQSLGFADDMVGGLSGEADLQRLQQSVRLYESASGSFLSHSKCFLYEVGKPSGRAKIGGWRVEKEQFRHLGVQLGRGVNTDLIWRAAADNTIQRMSSIPMWDLPIHIRCLIINIYCFTKILYLDKFMPAKHTIVRQIEEAAVKAVARKTPARVKEADLLRPREMGGFGLRHLSLHLQCTRAAWVADLLSDKWREQRHLGAFRLFISRQIAKASQLATNNTRPIWRFRVYNRSKLQHSYVQWPWLGVFTTETSYEDGNRRSEWDAAILGTRKLLPARWILYIEAWHAMVALKPRYSLQWFRVFVQDESLGWQSDSLHQYFHPRFGKKDNSLSVLASSYRTVLDAVSTLKRPSWHVELQNPQINWKEVWKILGALSKEASELENSLRLFLLGNFTTPASWASADLEQWPNNQDKACLFCSAQAESRHHLLEGCQEVQEILINAIGAYGDGFMRSFADKDIMDPEDMGMLRGRASAIHHLFEFIRSRRFSRNLLAPITAMEIDLLTKAISLDGAPVMR